jgi:hypothetical protein
MGKSSTLIPSSINIILQLLIIMSRLEPPGLPPRQSPAIVFHSYLRDTEKGEKKRACPKVNREA